MIILVAAIFAAVGLAACAFVVWPLLRPRSETEGVRNRLLLPMAAGGAVMAFGIGSYLMLGQPELALRGLRGPQNNDYPSLIAALATRMPERPNELQGWILLGQGYLSLGDANQATRALGRAVDLAQASGTAPPDLLSLYGQALTVAAGSVTKEAEDAFRQAAAEDPANIEARYYLGLAAATRGDKEAALALWETVLAEAPAGAPYRDRLIDQVAALKAQSGGGAPNPAAMVANLAARLDANPNDLAGWVRLIRAYRVLGDTEKAKAALVRARGVFSGKAEAQAALDSSAKENALN